MSDKLEDIVKLVKAANTSDQTEPVLKFGEVPISRMSGNKAQIDSFLHGTLIKYEQDRDNHREAMASLRGNLQRASATASRAEAERGEALRSLSYGKGAMLAIYTALRRHKSRADKLKEIRDVVNEFEDFFLVQCLDEDEDD